MKQRTAEKPEAVRIEPSAQAGFVEVVTVTNIAALPVTREDGQETTEYESDIYRLTYPVTDNLQEYAETNIAVFVELAKAEENAGQPTQNADKLAALMIENNDLRATQDDILIIITDMIGGAE
jgi:hypothetical protein